MRRPRSTWIAASLAVGLLGPPALGQQARPVAPPRAAEEAEVVVDPMAASRGARHLLRNGLDYIQYQEFDKALAYLREAERRQKELRPDEMRKLAQGIDQATRGLREPNHGRKAAAKATAPARRLPAADAVQLASGAAGSARPASPPADPALLPAEAPAMLTDEPAVAPPAPVASPVVIDETPAPPPVPLTPSSPLAPSAAPRFEPVPEASPAPAPRPAPVPSSTRTGDMPVPVDSLGRPIPPRFDRPAATPALVPESAPVPVPAELDPEPPAPPPALDATDPRAALPSRVPPAGFEYPELPGVDAPAPTPSAPAPAVARREPVEMPALPATARPIPAPAPARTVSSPRPAAIPDYANAPAPPAEEVSLPTLPGMATPPSAEFAPEVRADLDRIAARQEAEYRQFGPLGPPGTSRDDLSNSEATSRLILPRPPSPTEPRPIRAIPIPGDAPELGPRNFAPTRKYWAAAATGHGTLYFQDPALERYGQSANVALGPVGRFFSYPLDDPTQSNNRQHLLQPFASVGLFTFQIATLPYKLIVDPPTEGEYDLGYYRPGDQIPPDTIYLTPTGVGPPLRGKHYP